MPLWVARQRALLILLTLVAACSSSTETGATDGTVERYSRMMVEDIERFINGKRPKNLVNPEVWKENGD